MGVMFLNLRLKIVLLMATGILGSLIMTFHVLVVVQECFWLTLTH